MNGFNFRFNFTIDHSSNIDMNFSKTRAGIEQLDRVARELLVKTRETGDTMRILSNYMQTTANDRAIRTFQAASDDLDMIAASLNRLDEAATNLILKLKKLESKM